MFSILNPQGFHEDMYMNLRPIISCEHAGNAVPELYGHLFKGHDETLLSHRGWDPGALEMADFLSKSLDAPLYKCDFTRLLIEPNRSLSSNSLFSEFSQGLSAEQMEEALQCYYYPHRNTIEQHIRESRERILHLSVHSFTPVWHGEERKVDIGLLFDPARIGEVEFSERYYSQLKNLLPSFNIEFNEPYKGIDDGFTTHLRTVFPDECYLGIEIEVNQKYAYTQQWQRLSRALYNGLKKILK